MKRSSIRFETIVSLPFDENTYLLHHEGNDACLIVDPGFEPEEVFTRIEQKRLKPVAILNTHGHSDHIAGNAAMKERWPHVPLLIGHADADKLTDPQKNLSAPFGVRLISPQADQLVRHGDILELAGIAMEVRETPGHSLGHVVFILRGTEPWIVVGGDVLFRGGIGRSDFPDGDHAALVRSIRTELYPLPDSTIVLPGHGPTTTIGEEKRENPFVRG